MKFVVDQLEVGSYAPRTVTGPFKLQSFSVFLTCFIPANGQVIKKIYEAAEAFETRGGLNASGDVQSNLLWKLLKF